MFLTILGFLAGIIGGMGMGGGTILIPALVLFAHIDPKIAQSVNLLSSIPMTIFALIIHIRNKNVVFSLVIPIAIFGVLGAICGSFVANYLSSEILKKVFGGFLLTVGCIEIKKGFCDYKKEKCRK
ncbi:sulfite exporter TauE/SafE family protein [Romboutsia ilealis]|uniref:sulfite exporter TauE/SafE family protein n=1 Tax=Romboutsia ilealis TaxID=1115758 RepID=UPI0025726D4F|nr:sulfite exporter TauE/SafE family protein [Romboutsia ilealis]